MVLRLLDVVVLVVGLLSCLLDRELFLLRVRLS